MLELRQRVRPNGAAPFLHRLTGVLELRQRVRPDRAAPFSAPAERGTRTALAGSPFPGGEFFAEPQQGFAVCGRREHRGARRGGKKEGQPAVFLPLWTPTFPLLGSPAQIANM